MIHAFNNGNSGSNGYVTVNDTNLVDATAAVTSYGSNIVFNKQSSFVSWEITIDRFIGYNGIPDSSFITSFNKISLNVDANTTHYINWLLDNQHYKRYDSNRDLFVNFMSSTAAFYNDCNKVENGDQKLPLTVLVNKVQ
jgi:hypothetical protein